jgi:hypothetical protein
LRVYFFLKNNFYKMFPSSRDRLRIRISVLSLISIIAITTLGGTLEYTEYFIIFLCALFIIASILSSLLDRFREYCIRKINSFKTRKSQKKMADK